MGIHFGSGESYFGNNSFQRDALHRARTALRSCTSLTPSSRDRRKRGAVTFDTLEKRYLLSADISPYTDALDDGLDRLQILVDQLDSFAEFAADIPILGESLAEAAQLANTLQTDLLDPLRLAIASAVGTFETLETQIEGIAGIASNLIENGTEAQFEIAFDKTIVNGSNSFDFGAVAAQFGFAIDADFDFSIALSFDFTLGVLLDTSLSPSDSVYIDSGATMTLAGIADLEAAIGAGAVKVGLLGGASLDASSTFTLKASATATVTENSVVNDGRITLAELDASGLALVAVQINAADTGLTANLKLDSSGSITGLTLDNAGVTLSLTGDLFSNPTLNISIDTPDLADFTRMNAASLLSFLGDLGGKLETLSSAFNALAQIDFIDINVSDFSNFDSALRQVINSLSVPGLLGGALTDLADLATGGNHTFKINFSVLDPSMHTVPVPDVETISLDFAALQAAVDAAAGDTLDALAAAINTAIQAAAPGLPVEAFVRNGIIGLRATNDYVTDIVLTDVAAPITALLGFQNDLSALPLPTFATIQEFAAKLAALEIFEGTGANLAYDQATSSLTFDLDIGFDAVAFERTMSFNQALSLGPLGELALAGSAGVSVGAEMLFSFGAGFDLTELSDAVTLGALNGGMGVSTNPSGQPDLLFVTRDGIATSVDLSGVTTIGQLKTAISTGTGGRVTVGIDSFGSGLVLTDTSTPSGLTPIFSVAGGAFSSAIYDLGFGFGTTAAPGSDTIGGGLIIDRFFIDATSKASASIGIDIDDVNLYGAIGFLAVKIDNGGTTTPIGFALDLQLQDVQNTDALDRLYLSELGAQAVDDQSAQAFDGTGVSFNFTLADGTTPSVALGNGTIADAVTALNGVAGVDAFLNATGTGVVLVDTTAGAGTFAVAVTGADPGADILGFKLSNTDIDGDGVLRGASLVDGGFAALDAVAFDGGITGQLELPVSFEDGGAFGLDEAGFTLIINFEVGSILPTVNTTGLEDLLTILTELGASDLLSLVKQIASVVFDKLDLLNADLPLLDGSIGDFVKLVQDSVDAVVGPVTDRINTMLVYEVDKALAFLNPQEVDDLIADVNAAGVLDAGELTEFANFTPLSDAAQAKLVSSDAGHILIHALEELRAQVIAFGGAFDFFFSDAPTKLIAAFAAVRGAVQALRDEFSADTAFLDELEDTFGAHLRDIEDVIPSTNTILKLVQQALGFELPRLDDTLADVEDKLNDTLKQAIVDASDAYSDIADLADLTIAELVGLAGELLDDMGNALRTQVDALQAQIAALIDEAGDTIDDLPGSAADRTAVQTLLDALDDVGSFLTDENEADSLAQIVAKLTDIAENGEDIFDLISSLPTITRMLDGIAARLATFAGGMLADFNAYVTANVATFGATLVGSATAAANEVLAKAQQLADRAIDEFRATVLGLFGGGVLQFDYNGGRIEANLQIAPSVFDVNYEGVDFDFSFGTSLFNAGIEDSSLDFSLGGVFNLGLALEIGALSDDPLTSDFNLLVSEDTGFRLETSLTVDGVLVINAGGVGIRFENPTDPVLQLTNFAGDGAAFIDIGVTGTATDGWIEIADLGFSFAGEARLVADSLGYYKNGSPIMYDGDNDVNTGTDGKEAQVDFGFDAQIGVATGEFVFNAAINPLTSEELLAIAEGLIDFSNLLEAFELLLDFLVDATDSLASAPLIGGPVEGLNDVLTSFQTAYNSMKAQLEALEEGAADLVDQAKQIVFDALNSVLDEDQMKGNDGDANVFDYNDILLSFSVADRELILEPLFFGFTVEDTVPFDFGLDAFVVEVEGTGGVTVNFLLNVAMGFGLSADRGAFLVLPNVDDDELTLDPILTGEFSAGLTPDSELNLRLFFLGVNATPWDENMADANTPEASVGLGKGVGFSTNLALGLLNGGGVAVAVADLAGDETGAGNYKIGVSDLDEYALDVDFAIAVNIDLLLVGGADIGGGLSIEDLPNIQTKLNIDWMWSAGGGELQVPGVQFYDLSLNMGEWAQNALKPLLDFIDDFTAPLDPFLDFLNLEVPILSQLSELFGQGPLTVLDAIRFLGSGVESIEIFLQIVETIQAVSDFIDNLTAGTLIDFGDFIITDPYGSAPEGAVGSTAGLDLSGQSARTALTGLDLGATDGIGATKDQVDAAINADTNGADEGGGLSGILDSLNDIGLFFPFLQDPAQLFGVLFGQRIDFVVWDIPRLSAEFGVSYKFGPILPPVPLFVTIGGGFEIFLDLSVGYDSRGIETGAFQDGFYFGDHNFDPSTMKFGNEDILELGLSVFFEATASLSIVVAEAGVTGGVKAEIGANWADDDGDGKFYLDEIGKKLAEGILCIFDFEGALEAYLEAFVKLGFDTPFGFVTLFEDTFELLRVTLLDFTISCPPLPPPEIATVDSPSDTTARLNIGAWAGERQPGAEDSAEKVEIYGDRVEALPADEISLWETGGLAGAIGAGYFDDGKLTHTEAAAAMAAGYLNKDLDLNLDGDIDSDEIRAVRDLNNALGSTGADSFALLIGFGEWEVFNNLTTIYGDAGAEDDEIIGDATSLRVALHVVGGAGDDELLGGMAGDILLGGAGADIVRGFGGADRLSGDGAATADVTTGLTGVNNVTSSADGEDDVYGGDGGDVIYGGGAIDTLKGDGEDDTAASLDAADWIYGNDGEDFIVGHLGNDYLFGGRGADKIEGGAGDDIIRGDIDVAEGSSANTVKTTSPNSQTGETDLIIGGEGADFIRGDGGNDIVFGEADGFVLGALSHTTLGDEIYGDGGDDVIRGQYGNDRIGGGDGDDLLIGGAGADLIFGNDDRDTIWADLFPADGLPAVLPSDQSSADDYIEGGDGADLIFGQEGADRIIGGVSNLAEYGLFDADAGDTVYGGVGHDVILGDDGTITDASNYASNTAGTGGADVLYGEGDDDQIAGGRYGDTILGDAAGGTGEDILFGDEILRAGLSLTGTWNAAGTDGADLILGYGGSDLIVAGGDGDTAYGSSGDDLVAGDYAQLLLRATGSTLFDKVAWVISLDPTKGAADRLFGETGNDILIGGDDGDLISGGTASDTAEDDIILGDHGLVVRGDGSAFANDIFSIFGNVGGEDEIYGAGGADIIIGGQDDDRIFGGSADDVILGDAGLVLRDADTDVERVISTFAGIDVTGIAAAPAAFAAVELGLDADDVLATGDDDIDAGTGSDVAIGGLASDLIYGRAGGDVLLGDNGEVLYTGTGSGLAAIVTVRTRGTNGGIDAILGEGGRDIAMGGAQGDFIFGDLTAILPRSVGSFDLSATFSAVSGADQDALAGDFGELTVQGGTPVLLQSTDTASGGRDLIEGNEGNDVVIGGADSDALHGDAAAARIDLLVYDTTDTTGDDIVIGDSGLVDWIDSGDTDALTVDLIQTTAPGAGASDVIFGNNGRDILIGGAGGDRIYGDRSADVNLTDLSISNAEQGSANGYDRILGDNGFVDFVIPEDSVSGRADIGTDPVTLAAGTILISASDPTFGGDDLILGDGMSDLIFGGTGADRIWGDDGGDFPADTPAGDDLILGDHGKAWQTVGSLGRSEPWVGDDYFAIFTGAADGGAGDVIFGEDGNDIVLGQQGDDVLFGNDGHDDLIGGHNTAGGSDDLDGLNAAQVQAILPDEWSDLDPTDLQDVNDILSGGDGEDVITGDNAIVVREGISVNERYQLHAGGGLYSMLTGVVPTILGDFSVDLGFAPNIGGAVSDPSALLPRNVFLLDFDASIESAAANNPSAPRPFGDDVIAGGADNDEIFGQLGDDVIQGDGDIALVAANTVDPFDPGVGTDPSFVIMDGGANVLIAPQPVLPVQAGDLAALQFLVGAAATDGDDYIEGNGGNDRVYGNLGQDDLIGGSSELASKALFSTLAGAGLRPDGADLIYGGAGDPEWLARSADVGDTTQTLVTAANANTLDADFIVGDNANVYRLQTALGGALAFNYASGTGYSGGYAIRVAQMLDYAHTIDGTAINPETGTVDWKTTFNDFGVGAGDLIHGESGDDVVFGMTGDDLIYGEAGNDDLYGQAGADVILGGRGVDGILGDDGLLSTSRNGLTEPLIGLSTANLQDIIRTPGNLQIELIYRTGDLLKTANLIAFDLDGVTFSINGIADAQMTSANDILFGGWEDDFIHGGYGDDATSGAEALAVYYAGGTLVNDFLRAQQDTGAGSPPAADDPFWYGIGLYNPGDILRFGAFDPEEFALYDEDDPRSRIVVTETVNGGQVVLDFLLNNDAQEGVLDDTFTQSINTDGADNLFGDLGNDWLVGGTGRDHMFGGRGNDMHQMDDDLSTGANDTNRAPDAYQEYADIAFDGAGRDYLILNTGADRAISWVGEYNSFIVPFSPFGAFQIARLLQPQTEQFVLDLAEASGADGTLPDILRFAEQIAIDNKLASPLDPAVFAERRGAPFDELGMVRQEDFDWTDQSGPPDDPQAGNLKGPRDVMRREIWLPEDTALANNLRKLEAQEWSLVEQAFAEAYGDDATITMAGLLKVKQGTQVFGTLGDTDDEWGTVEFSTKVEVEKFGKKDQANAYALFDMTDGSNFKYAGLNVSGDKIVIGVVIKGKWTVLASVNFDLKNGVDYKLTVRLDGNSVAVLLNDVQRLSHTFADSVVDGGYGVAATGVQATFKDTVITGAPPIVVADEATEAVVAEQILLEEEAAAATEPEAETIDWGTTSFLGTTATFTTTTSLTTEEEIAQTMSSDTTTSSAEVIIVEAWMPREDFAA